MAVKAQEVQVLGTGIQANAPSKGSFALNMLYKNNCWQVRKGFGQVTQFDTMMAAPTAGSSSVWGFTKHLGSRLIKTGFGNLQMVSVFLADVNLAVTALYAPQLPIYVVSIYDLTTNERFEIPLYPHTSQTTVSSSFDDSVPDTLDGRSVNLVAIQGVEGVLPQYQTAHLESYDAWLRAKDEFFFFEEFNDILYFGNSDSGLWAYLPASFNGLRPTVIDKFSLREYAQPYGESNIITPVVLSPGLNPESFDYVRTSDMPSPVDVAVVQNRMVYASGNTLYWSDPGFPSNIIADNWLLVPSEEAITAIAELDSNLVIFTENETWLYQPSIGELVSRGRLTRASDTVGCVGANANCNAGGALIWVDTSGVYQTTNGLTIQPISQDITPFFESEGITNPLTSYFVEYGQTAMILEQPTTTLRMKPKGACCAFVASMDMLVVSLPEMSASLVFSGGKWSWWTFESMVRDRAGSAKVGALQNVPAPWVMNYQDDLFVIAGPDIEGLQDSADTAGGSAVDVDTTSRSFFILEYGRGGAIDRSISYEDDRKITGYGSLSPASGPGATPIGGLYIDDPIPVPAGYIFPSGVTTAGDGNCFLLPISVVPASDLWDPASEGIDTIRARLSFDATHWRPVFNHATVSTVELMLPTERLATSSGWTVRTYSDSGFTTASQSGAYLQMDWAGAGLGNYHEPHMNLNFDRHNLLIFLPVTRLTALNGENTSGLAWEIVPDGSGHTQLYLDDAAGAGPLSRIGLHVFNRWSLGTGFVREEDDKAQPVDWAYKSTNVGLEGGQELKMRGVWANILSHGVGAERLNTLWPYGLFNTLVGSDRKEWMAQVVDFAPVIPSPNPPQGAVVQQDSVAPFDSTSTLRTRVQSSGGHLFDKAFRDSPNGSRPVWGDPSASGSQSPDAAVLIGDEDTSEISVSMSVKGQSFSVMHFGFIMNRAEKLFFEGIKAVFRIVGGRRRRGR